MATQLCEELVEWFYRIPTNEVVSYDIIAKKIRDIRIDLDLPDKGKAITQEVVNRNISEVRRELELTKQTTLVNLRNRGFKLANKDELALTTAKWVKRTVMYADRTYRLVDIVDRKRIPGALAKVFGDTEGKIKNLSAKSRAFALAFVRHSEEQRKIAKENEHDKEGKK